MVYRQIDGFGDKTMVYRQIDGFGETVAGGTGAYKTIVNNYEFNTQKNDGLTYDTELMNYTVL